MPARFVDVSSTPSGVVDVRPINPDITPVTQLGLHPGNGMPPRAVLGRSPEEPDWHYVEGDAHLAAEVLGSLQFAKHAIDFGEL